MYAGLRGALFEAWPKFSGSIVYPVPGCGGRSGSWAYNYAGDVWVGEYGDLRWELLDFMIE